MRAHRGACPPYRRTTAQDKIYGREICAKLEPRALVNGRESPQDSDSSRTDQRTIPQGRRADGTAQPTAEPLPGQRRRHPTAEAAGRQRGEAVPSSGL